MLLHWCTAEPQGPSNIAAIRFNSSVRIHSLRIFPAGARPFAQDEELIAETEPDEFYLNLYFNAAPTNPKIKLKTNALVTTSLAFDGRQADYAVNMDEDYATRLVILQGDFTRISMAIYGEIVAEAALPSTSYIPRSIPTAESTPLSAVLDVANSPDPTSLARRLLELIPNCPPLTLIFRIVLSFPLDDDEWDDPNSDFPYIHADLTVEEGVEFDLQAAAKRLRLSVAEDTSPGVIDAFVLRVCDCVGNKSNSQAFQVANLLAQAAGQRYHVARLILQRVQLADIFDELNMDEKTLQLLLEASANVDIARALNEHPTLDNILAVARDPTTAPGGRKAAAMVIERIRGWFALEDAFSNTQADFTLAAAFLKEISSSAFSLGIFLDSLINHPDIVAEMTENAVLRAFSSLASPPALWSDEGRGSLRLISHDEFLAFLRAFVGIVCTTVTFYWADRLPNRGCRDRSLSIIRLWQDIPGYREIVNHLLPMSNIMWRIENRMNGREPESSQLDAEHILLMLTQSPRIFMHKAVRECIYSLKSPLMAINELQLKALQHAADVAHDGVSGAVRELVNKGTLEVPEQDLCVRVHTLRVAIAVIAHELEQVDNGVGEWEVLRSSWLQDAHGLVCHLLDRVVQLSVRLKEQFGLKIPAHRGQATTALLFQVTDDLLLLSSRLLSTFPIPMRQLRATTRALADIFVCTDDADVIYAQGSSACIAAQAVRQTCIDTIRALSGLSPATGGSSSIDRTGSEIVLRTLLEYGVQPAGDCGDPAHHIGQVFWLVDYTLPEIDSADPRTRYAVHIWLRTVLGRTLPVLQPFFKSLDPDNRIHLLKRLVLLDSNSDDAFGAGAGTGVTGIGEFLLKDELHTMLDATRTLEDPLLAEHRRLVCQFQLYTTLRLVRGLVLQQSTHIPSASAPWIVSMLAMFPDSASALAETILFLLEHNMASSRVDDVAQVLASSVSDFVQPLQFAVVVAVLRASGSRPSTFLHLGRKMLEMMKLEYENVNPLRTELGHAFAGVAEHLETKELTMTADLAEQLYAVFVWLTKQSVSPRLRSLPGLTMYAFQEMLCVSMAKVLPGDIASTLDTLKPHFEFPDELLPVSSISPLTEDLRLSFDQLNDLLTPLALPEPPSTPTKQTFSSPDPLSHVSVSPQTALLRSPVTGLTKTYANNEFRQLRNIPSISWQGVGGRLPSKHVDDFETGELNAFNSSPPSPLDLASTSPQQRYAIGQGEPSPLGAAFFMR